MAHHSSSIIFDDKQILPISDCYCSACYSRPSRSLRPQLVWRLPSPKWHTAGSHSHGKRHPAASTRSEDSTTKREGSPTTWMWMSKVNVGLLRDLKTAPFPNWLTPLRCSHRMRFRNKNSATSEFRSVFALW